MLLEGLSPQLTGWYQLQMLLLHVEEKTSSRAEQVAIWKDADVVIPGLEIGRHDGTKSRRSTLYAPRTDNQPLTGWLVVNYVGYGLVSVDMSKRTSVSTSF